MMLSVANRLIMLSVIMLNVTMLSVVAPFLGVSIQLKVGKNMRFETEKL